ncbi:hypothetical protein OIDMADRAFT_23020 [Oidiodendron maius Zn]|uniref:Uncharacterized protein n=1 Tax=Oidiodendron maius (strain Zn) TaxID=913774 RepID=A0A0C3HJ22_OIDMZ|nr:hypothetical protein OIDMADRAFT_23020 [Oidiodendron maius Zn]
MTRIASEGSATNPPNEAGASINVEYWSEDIATAADVERYSNICQDGFQLREIYWESEIMQTTDNIAERTLDGEPIKKPNIMENIKVVNDFDIDKGSKQDVFVVKEDLHGIWPSSWALL